VTSEAAEAVVHSANAREGGTQAIQDACAKLEEEMAISAILAVASQSKRGDVVLTVLGPATPDRFQELSGLLKGLPGIGEVEELYCTEKEARLRAGYKGEVASLLEGLTSKGFSDFRLEVTRVVGREITLKLIP
jgi:hypothetical protein